MKRAISWIVSLGMLVTAMCVFAPAALADVTYTFGTADGKGSPPAFKEQGQDGFYAYYSKEYNKGGKVSESSLILCEYYKNKLNSYGMTAMQPKEADIQNYTTTIWPARYPDNADDPQFWWRIDSKGTMCPAGDMTAAVGFKAPADGTYVVNVQCDGGAKLDGNADSTSDGVSFGMSFKNQSLWAHNTQRSFILNDNPVKAPQQTLAMKKGETVYFMTDPNNHYSWDASHWYITVVQKIAETSTSAVATTTTAATSGKTAGSTTVTSAPSQTAGDTSGTEEPPATVSADTAPPTDGSRHADDTTAPAGGNSGGSMLPVVLGILAGVVVLGGGGTAAYFLYRKKKGAV